jgi:cell wall-associated NlpC family hydrolase
MTHWANSLVGKPYRAGASGPDAFDCIGLVRHCFKSLHGVDLPDYAVHYGSPEDLRKFTRATGWRRGAFPAVDQDLLVMEGLDGRHVGIVVATSDGLGLLHAAGTNDHGQVVWQPLDTLFGYRNIEIWRRSCT